MTPQDSVALEVLAKVDAFYRSSWVNLVSVGVAAAFFVGVVVPVLATLYQRRLFKIEKEDLERTVNALVEAAKSSLASEHQRDLKGLRTELAEGIAAAEKKADASFATLRAEEKEALESTKAELKRSFAGLRGGILMVQAAGNIRAGDFVAAATSEANAVVAFAEAGDDIHIGRALNILIDGCLPKITKQALGDPGEAEAKFKEMEEALRPLNTSGAYSDRLAHLRRALKADQSPVSK